MHKLFESLRGNSLNCKVNASCNNLKKINIRQNMNNLGESMLNSPSFNLDAVDATYVAMYKRTSFNSRIEPPISLEELLTIHRNSQ